MTAALYSTQPLVNHPCLKPAFEELKKVTAWDHSHCITQLSKIALALHSFDCDYPSLKGRVHYLSNKLNGLLDKYYAKLLEPKEFIRSLIKSLVIFKSSLQREIIFYGSISSTFDVYYTLSQSPAFKEIFHEIPFIFKNIQFDLRTSCFHINIHPLEEYFDKLDFDQLIGSIDTNLIQLFKNYEVVDNQLHIPMDQLPTKEKLEAYIEGSDFHSKLIAQMVLFCHVEKDLIRNSHIIRPLYLSLLKSLEDTGLDDYLDALTPHLAYLRTAVTTLKAKDPTADPFHILFDKEFLEKDQIHKKEWLENAASFFELVLAIENHVYGIVPGYDDLIKPGTIKIFGPVVEEDTRAFHEFAKIHDYPIYYPIDKDHPFATTKAAVKLLSPEEFFTTNERLLEEKQRKELERAEKLKRAASKQKPKHKKTALPLIDQASPKKMLAATGGAGTAAIEDTSDPVEDKLCKIFVKKTLSKTEDLSPPLSLEASLVESYKQLAKLHYHERIKVWQRSIEEGLAYYGFGKDGMTHDLSQEEMILRHYLPKDLLVLALNPFFGIKKAITLKTGEVIENHFESCLLINGKKYVLEVSINTKGVLFHFYARRATSIASYQKRGLTHSATESFLIQNLAKGSTPIDSVNKEFDDIDGKTILFDEAGNAHIAFKDGIYIVPKLNGLF